MAHISPVRPFHALAVRVRRSMKACRISALPYLSLAQFSGSQAGIQLANQSWGPLHRATRAENHCRSTSQASPIRSLSLRYLARQLSRLSIHKTRSPLLSSLQGLHPQGQFLEHQDGLCSKDTQAQRRPCRSPSNRHAKRRRPPKRYIRQARPRHITNPSHRSNHQDAGRGIPSQVRPLSLSTS